MQISEILRKIAELTDLVSQDEGKPVVAQPEMDVTATISHCEPVDADANDKPNTETATMVSPLQQEHELLKKSQGVDNNVAEFADPENEDYGSELAAMKKSAGIGETNCAQAQKGCSDEEVNPRKNAALAFHKARSDRSA